MAGGTLEKLKEMMGHYSVVMTERYAHLRADLFATKDLETIDLALVARSVDRPPRATGRHPTTRS